MYVMITDGGPHAPEKWAAITAQQIIEEIEQNAPQVGIGEAREFRAELTKLFTGHHEAVQESERAAIARLDDRLMHPLEPGEILDSVIGEVVSLASRHSFAAYFVRPQTQEYLRHVIGHHFATSMFIERSWHADRNPATEAARAFRARHYPEA